MARNVYSLDFKKQILHEANESGNAADVARKHGINPKLLYSWKGQLSKNQTNQLNEPNQFQTTGELDLQLVLSQLKDVQSKLEVLKVVHSLDDVVADIKATTARIESMLVHSLEVMREQLSEVKTMLALLNMPIGNASLTLHNKSPIDNPLPPQQLPMNSDQILRARLEQNINRQLGII
jgi:transposase